MFWSLHAFFLVSSLSSSSLYYQHQITRWRVLLASPSLCCLMCAILVVRFFFSLFILTLFRIKKSYGARCDGAKIVSTTHFNTDTKIMCTLIDVSNFRYYSILKSIYIYPSVYTPKMFWLNFVLWLCTATGMRRSHTKANDACTPSKSL